MVCQCNSAFDFLGIIAVKSIIMDLRRIIDGHYNFNISDRSSRPGIFCWRMFWKILGGLHKLRKNSICEDFFWWFMSAVMKIYMLMFYVLVYVYVLINNIVSILFIQAKFSFTFEMGGHNLPWSTDKFWVIICSSNNQPNGLSNLFKCPVKLIAGFITACLFSALINHRKKSFKW